MRVADGTDAFQEILCWFGFRRRIGDETEPMNQLRFISTMDEMFSALNTYNFLSELCHAILTAHHGVILDLRGFVGNFRRPK